MNTTILKSVRVSKETRNRIRELQTEGETVNVVILKLLEKYEGLL